jgi:hypothetical protein
VAELNPRQLESIILNAIFRASNDDWAQFSLGSFRQRLREINGDAANLTINTIADVMCPRLLFQSWCEFSVDV